MKIYVSLDKEVPVKFWKKSGSEVWIRSPYPNILWIILLDGRMRSLTDVCYYEPDERGFSSLDLKTVNDGLTSTVPFQTACRTTAATSGEVNSTEKFS